MPPSRADSTPHVADRTGEQGAARDHVRQAIAPKHDRTTVTDARLAVTGSENTQARWSAILMTYKFDSDIREVLLTPRQRISVEKRRNHVLSGGSPPRPRKGTVCCENVAHRSNRSPPVQRPPPENADFLIVGVGTSAGGLDACRKLLRALPDSAGMAFVLVQHLDPNHESLMVDLLAGYTSMTVRQAANGMPIEREHLYVIPPGTYLSVGGGVLHLSPPPVRHGARLPFDHLLHSLAADYGARAACVVLSGTGTDGSLGLRAVKEKHGLVIVQDPEEAAYDGMPRSAIMTGLVDRVVPVAQIPQALAEFAAHMTPGQEPAAPALEDRGTGRPGGGDRAAAHQDRS